MDNLYKLLRESDKEIAPVTPKESMPNWSDSGHRIASADIYARNADYLSGTGDRYIEDGLAREKQMARALELINKNPELGALLEDLSGRYDFKDMFKKGANSKDIMINAAEGIGTGAAMKAESMDDLRNMQRILSGQDPVDPNEKEGMKRADKILKSIGLIK